MKPGSTIEKVNRAINDGPRSLLVLEILISPIGRHDRKPRQKYGRRPVASSSFPVQNPRRSVEMGGSKITAEVSWSEKKLESVASSMILTLRISDNVCSDT